VTRAGTALVLATCAALGAGGCVVGLGKSLQEYSLLDVEDRVPASTRPISSEQSEKVILGIAFDADFCDRAWRDLLAACPRGEVLNVRARHSTELGFFAFRRKIRIDADCADGASPTARARSRL
jgi:hypothetical protein